MSYDITLSMLAYLFLNKEATLTQSNSLSATFPCMLLSHNRSGTLTYQFSGTAVLARSTFKGGGGGGAIPKTNEIVTLICSCHNFFSLSSVQILFIPACCLLCVL